MPTENKPALSQPEVKRWQLKGFIPGVEGESKAVFRPVVVLASDFDAAQAELAVLREAFESMRDRKNSIVDLQQRLAAAKQRNAELIELLRDIRGADRAYATQKIDAALQSTESGASERNHEIPGTSGMRLNMQANEGE